MATIDVFGDVLLAELMPADSYSTTAGGGAVDISGLEGVAAVALTSEAGTAGTLDVVIQHSYDGSTGWATVKDENGDNVAFTRVTNTAAAFEVIKLDLNRCRRYIRAYHTIATGPFVFAVVLAATVKHAPASYD